MVEAGRLGELLDKLREFMVGEERVKAYLGGRGLRLGGVVIVEDFKGPLAVLGDIHGDYGTFSKILDDVEGEGVIDSGLLILLGDYVDRGPPEGQVETLMRIAELKLEMGDRLVALRGNHEPPENLVPYPHDYPYVLEQLFGRDKALELYRKSLAVFNSLPHALVLKGKALLVHGGPPTRLAGSLEDYLGWDRRVEVIEEILWNDPSELVETRAPNPRGAGSLWGRRVTDKALSLSGASIIVRGHEPALEGYKFNHGRRVLTLFSRLGEPYFNIAAAYIVCGDVEELSPQNVALCLRRVPANI
ncbi:MAG: metallophosphoesterase family protein [Thermoprotei archaeon]|nr:metallophosphoesterase family protein [Thermoprotei archaeon]